METPTYKELEEEVQILREEVRLLESEKARLEATVDRLEDDLIEEREARHYE